MPFKRLKRWQQFTFLECFLAAVLILYLNKWWLYPEYPSQDFASHISLATALLQGQIPPLNGLVLYFDAEFYLAGWLLLFGHPFTTARIAMSVLILISPLVCYHSFKQVAGERAAWLFTLLWALYGVVWYDMVVDSGIFPNFVGILLSISLMATTVALLKQPNKKKAALFGIVFILSMFSHYSLLVIMPVLIGWCAYQKNRNGLAIGSALASPLLAGAVLFPSVLSTLFSFQRGGESSGAPASSFIASLIGWPSLSFIFSAQAWDVGAVLIGLLAIAALWKVRGAKVSVPLLWFLLALLSAPLDSSAWRFSLVAVVPLLMLAALGLERVHKWRRQQWAFPAVILILILMGGWVFRPVPLEGMLIDSLDNPNQNRDYQGHLSQSFAWMDSQRPNCFRIMPDVYTVYKDSQGAFDIMGQPEQEIISMAGPVKHECKFLALSDWHFTLDVASFGPILQNNSDWAYNFAKVNGFDYIITSSDITNALYGCYAVQGRYIAYPVLCNPFQWKSIGDATIAWRSENITIWHIPQS